VFRTLTIQGAEQGIAGQRRLLSAWARQSWNKAPIRVFAQAPTFEK
jgi:hypothetical protein